jgi:hypothetical protein
VTDRTIKMGTTMPTGDANGLADPDVIREMFDDPTKMRVGIVIFNAPKFDGDTEAGTETRKLTIRRVEVILDDTKGDASALQRLLVRAYERRTGATTLNTDLEEDVRAAFDGLNIIDLDAEERPDGRGGA